MNHPVIVNNTRCAPCGKCGEVPQTTFGEFGFSLCPTCYNAVVKDAPECERLRRVAREKMTEQYRKDGVSIEWDKDGRSFRMLPSQPTPTVPTSRQ
jgi:hypothetical protein